MLVEAWALCAFSSKNISCSFDLNHFGSKDIRSLMQLACGNMKISQRWKISRRSNWGDMWDGYMVFLSFSTRLQWLPEAVFSVKLHQLHLSMFLLSRFWMNRLGSCLVFCIHSDTIQKIIMPWSTIVQNEDSAWTTPSRLENAWFSVVVWMTYLFLSSIAQAF